MPNRTAALSAADRAVYHFVETGQCDAAHAALYKRQLSALRRAGLVLPRADGSWAPVPPRTDPPPPPAAESTPARRTGTATPVSNRIPSVPPPSPPPAPQATALETLVARVPPEWLEAIDGLRGGRTRSDVVRELLEDALTSTRRAS